MDQNQKFEYLFQKGLDMENQMEKIIKDAQPKPKQEMKIKYAKPIIITRDLLTGTPEYQAQKQLSDLELDQQIQNTIKQAIRAADNKPPEKYTNAVTEEMINDYRKEVIKPIDIKGKKFLYRSVEVPPIPKPADTPYTGIERTEAEAQNAVEDLIDDINDLEADYEANIRETLRLEAVYTTSTTAPAFDPVARKNELQAMSTEDLKKILTSLGGTKGRSQKPGIIVKIIDIENQPGRPPEDIKAQIDQLELDAKKIVDDIKRKRGQIRQIQSNYALQLQVDEENRLKKVEHENLQRQQNEQLLNDFNRLNKGRTQLARQQDESEDDFYLRLVAMGNVEADPAAIEKQIQTDILIKAKKNILELTNDMSKAETAVKLLSNDERFRMNKVFPKIKKNYSETFGLNNKDMDANEISDFIQNELTTGPSVGSDDVMISKLKKLGKKRLYFLVDVLNDADPSLNLFKGSVDDTINDLDRIFTKQTCLLIIIIMLVKWIQILYSPEHQQ
jgi:hypothetical protein